VRRKGSARIRHVMKWNEALTGILELPSDDRVPLIQFEGKVSVTVYPFGVV